MEDQYQPVQYISGFRLQTQKEGHLALKIFVKNSYLCRERKHPQINLSHVFGVAETGLGGLKPNIFDAVEKQHVDNDKN